MSRAAAPARLLVVMMVIGCVVGCRRTAGGKSEQDEYVEDTAAFTGTTRAEVMAKLQRGSAPIKEEWEAWEKQGEMTPERIKAFYKQTPNYIYDLGSWHLWNKDKRESDLAMFEEMKTKYRPKNILDFGGGVGLVALPLARAGFDVTLADLDSETLRFALFRAQRRGIRVKTWKSDVEAAPPDAKYDVILVLDVLEHLPQAELDDVVERLIKLKHDKTLVVMSAPFGRTATHPMHLDLTDHTRQQIQRLMTEIPKG